MVGENEKVIRAFLIGTGFDTKIERAVPVFKVIQPEGAQRCECHEYLLVHVDQELKEWVFEEEDEVQEVPAVVYDAVNIFYATQEWIDDGNNNLETTVAALLLAAYPPPEEE